MKTNTIIFVAVLIAAVFFGIVSCVFLQRSLDDEARQKEIVEYLLTNTEDVGKYAIQLQKCTAWDTGEDDLYCYFANMIDDDGDYEMLFVKYYDLPEGKAIESYEILWK